jgi:hypothetical protein
MAKGLVLESQVTSPFGSGQSGIYLDTNGGGSLIIHRDGEPAQNVSAAISGGAPAGAVVATMTNNSGSSIAAFKPVSSDVLGEMAAVNVSDVLSSHLFVGLTNTSVSDGDAAQITTFGKIENITGITLGAPVFVSKTGGLTQLYPTAGVDGFVSGDYCIKVGAPIKNQDNPSNIDLIVSIQMVGQIP